MDSLDLPLNKGKEEISLSAFGFLFSELVQYFQNRVMSMDDLERKLEEAGYQVGLSLLELYSIRDNNKLKRENRLLGILQFISTNFWRILFGKNADSLERSMDNADEYMIHESDPITNRFVSVPSHMGHVNCAAYIAGIIAGILDGASFPAQVTAHFVSQGSNLRDKTVFLVKFNSEVMQREVSLG